MQRHRERFVQGAMRHAGAERACAERVWEMVAGLRRLRLPQVPQRRLRAARLPVDVAARALRPGVPVRAAERAADGLLRPRQPRSTRRSCAGIAVRGVDVNASEVAVHRAGRRRAARARLRQGRPRGEVARARRASASAAGPFGSARRARRARPAPARATLEQLAWSGACDSLLAEDVAARAPHGAVAARGRGARRSRVDADGAGGHPARAAARARRRRRACARSGAGSG